MELLAEGELEVRNPATLERVGAVPATAPEAVQEAVTEARLAQERWAESTWEERRSLLGRVASYLLDNLDEVTATITAETGKPLVESITSDALPALDSLVWLGANAERVLRAERLRFPQPHLRHKKGWLVYDPRGVVGIVSPWNYPLGLPLTQVATAVVAGNAVVLKPSELTPLTGAWVERAFAAAGAPPALVRVVQGDGATGAALVRARGLGKVVFTGSVEVGRQVGAATGERLVPVTLELGGKDPMVVFEDADLDRAVDGALWGSFLNCGQTCAGVERIYVQRALYQPFVEELVRRTRALRLGRGDQSGVELGPLISEEQRAKVEELVADALERGGEARAGAARPPTDLPGWFYEPTVLVDVPADARVHREEIFGPVVVVEPFDDELEAVRRANDSRFGLGASVWTRDAARAHRVAQRLDAGCVWTNDFGYSYGACQAPWGGRKDSGFGRTHSKHGLYEMSSIKYVDADGGRVRVPWWYPYDERVAEGFRGALGLLYRQDVRAKVSAAWRDRRGLVALGRRYLR
jgi:succinate-semialdehyde dehydrogenase/glutarate-semialdehyde dehydrogenase